MGLDLLPAGSAKPGHEAEWNRFMEALYRGEEETEESRARRLEISIPPYEIVDAPRVGFDKAADEWFVENADNPEGLTPEVLIARNKGYCVLDLLVGKCDGVAEYTHGDLYDGVDRTSFRGSFLQVCTDVADQDTIEQAWTQIMRPDEAASYGQCLLSLADEAERLRAAGGMPSAKKKSLLSSIFSRKSKEPIEEQIKILRAAGRWYVFWGERGNPILAWS